MKPSGPPSTRYRSPDFNPRLGILTDSQIEKYILKGFYGEAERQKLLDQRSAASSKSSSRRKATTPGTRKRPSVSDALRALGFET